MREAPSISVIQALVDAGAKIRAHDPEGMTAAREILPDIEYADDAYQAATGADALVIVTEWNAFRSLDFARLKSIMNAPVLVDLRNIYRRAEVEPHGFTYESVGRPARKPGGQGLATAAE
jgi:UDPglucose 6-dehydrogenase